MTSAYGRRFVNTETAPPAAAPWHTEQLRLSAFPESGRPAGLARDWWNAITGAPPDNVVEEPRNGIVKLRGRFEGGLLFMVADENRLDLRQRFGLDRPGAALTALPELNTALGPFVQLAQGWLRLDTHPPLQRLAFGAVVMKPSARIEDCREVLRGYLPSINMDTTELRDFLYQANRRRSAETISGLEVNRLTKWSIQGIQEIVVSGSRRVAVSDLTFGSRLELDINSDPEQGGSLRSNRLVPLFDEFVRLADEITRVGDQP